MKCSMCKWILSIERMKLACGLWCCKDARLCFLQDCGIVHG